MKVLITGGCGFIGSHFVRMALKKSSNHRVLNLDALTYAGRGRNLADLQRHPRYRFVRGDISKPNVEAVIQRFRPDIILNFAAESHVDRSTHDALSFLQANTMGTQNLLSIARKLQVPRFVQISTDEVYGSIPGKAKAREDAPPLCPRRFPYAPARRGDHALYQ
jgi:dTDP-glucose 4,6-dehydratase